MALGKPARAGVLAGQPNIYGPGIPRGVPVGETVNANNDNIGMDNPNQISLVGLDIMGLDPIDILIPASSSSDASGTTEYILMLGTAANMTDVAWSGFEIELGSGIGADFVRLSTRALPGVSGLDFDTPDRDPPVSSPSFSSITHDADLLSFSGGNVSVGEVASAQNFSIDIPDTTNTADSTYHFTIRLRPVPVQDLGGDYDQDGDIDGSDLLVWQRDLSLWPLSYWQEGYDSSSGSDWLINVGLERSLASGLIEVPEPLGLVMLLEVLVICRVVVVDCRLGQ
jgi:hypothetical protein